MLLVAAYLNSLGKWSLYGHSERQKVRKYESYTPKKIWSLASYHTQKNYPDIVRTFLEKGTASKWSKLIETQMDKKVFQDMSGAESTTLSQLVIKYRDEIVPELKSAKMQTYKLNKLLRHKICYYNLLQQQYKS